MLHHSLIYLVPLVAEVTGPQFGSVVHLAETHRVVVVTQVSVTLVFVSITGMVTRCVPERVEHSTAGGTAAENRLILDWGQVRSLLQGREQRCNRHHHPGRLQPTGWPHVPAEAHAIPLLILSDVLWEGRHGNAGRWGVDKLSGKNWGWGVGLLFLLTYKVKN